MLSSRMAHPELTGLVTLAFIIIFGPILYNFNVETVKVVSDYHEETNGSDEVLTISSCFWAGVLGGVASVLYIYCGNFLWLPVSILLAVWRMLGLEPRRCSYCLVLGAGEGVCQEGEQVWVCKTCRSALDTYFTKIIQKANFNSNIFAVNALLISSSF